MIDKQTRRNAVRALSKIDQLIEGVVAGDEDAIERSRLILLREVAGADTVRLSQLLVSFRIAFEQMLADPTGEREPEV